MRTINIPVGSETHDGTFKDLERLKTIEEEVKNSCSQYSLVDGKEENYYHLYAQDTLSNLKRSDKNIILISSHADNLQDISLFNEYDDYVEGTLDNVGTNAICVYLMKNILLPTNVIFAFTADEEVDSTGARKLSERLKEIFGENRVNVIVLDVTCGGFKEIDFTVENDFIYIEKNGETYFRKICDSISELQSKWKYVAAPIEGKKKNFNDYIDVKDLVKTSGCNSINQYLNEDLWVDEACEYNEAGFNVFSLCLPTSAKNDVTMHDNKGFYISKNSIPNFTKALHKMIIEVANL